MYPSESKYPWLTIRMLSQLNTLAVILTLVIHQVLVEGQCVPKGTTPDIRELVLGRCVDYQTNINPGPFCVNGVSNHTHCTALADKFTSAFAFQPVCNVSYSRYDDFLKAAEIDVPPGQDITPLHAKVDEKPSHQSKDTVKTLTFRYELSSMFWSGVYGVVQMYSNRGRRATVLEDTLIGYMVDGLQFCAQTGPPGITYGADCPGFGQTANCTNNAEFSFWAMASKHYASHASGEAHVMLNASRDQPFRDSSFFATWEVPNMNASQLSKVNILMVHIPGQKIRSTCNSNNISELKKRLRDRNIASSCQDSPRGPQTMLCVDYPGERECDMDRTTSASSNLVSVGVHIAVLNAALKSISL